MGDLRTKSLTDALLLLAALAAVAAAIVHLAALAVPALNASTYSPAYPWWRHVVFIAINVALAALLQKPPAWLVWPYSLLTIQVLYSHGLGGFREWKETGRLHWIDVVAVLGVPLLLGLLVVERRRTVHLKVDTTPVRST
jgi:hypothetical protein